LLSAGMRRLGAFSAASFASWWALATCAPVIAGLLAWALATALWLVVLAREQLSYAYVLGSLNYVLVPVAARLLFAERIGSLRWAGMALIAVGVAVTVLARAGEAAR